MMERLTTGYFGELKNKMNAHQAFGNKSGL
jgi:hypothetical protein